MRIRLRSMTTIAPWKSPHKRHQVHPRSPRRRRFLVQAHQPHLPPHRRHHLERRGCPLRPPGWRPHRPKGNRHPQDIYVGRGELHPDGATVMDAAWRHVTGSCEGTKPRAAHYEKSLPRLLWPQPATTATHPAHGQLEPHRSTVFRTIFDSTPLPYRVPSQARRAGISRCSDGWGGPRGNRPSARAFLGEHSPIRWCRSCAGGERLHPPPDPRSVTTRL